MKARVLNTFSISKCFERIDVRNTFRIITMWKHCFEHFFHFKMFWQKWCSKHSCYNFHMKTHVLNTFSISRCSERNDVHNTLGAISLWLTFWTLFLFQDVLKEVMFQTLLAQFPYENSRFEHFFHFNMFWKKWCPGHSWDNVHVKTHDLDTFSISRCSERSDVPHTFGTISTWKLTFWTFFSFQDVLKEVMFKTLLEQFPNENSGSEFFSFQDVLKEVMFKTLLEQFPNENSRFEHFFHFKMFWKKWYWKNPLGKISKWKLTFWIFLSFQDVLKEVMFRPLLEQFPCENLDFEHFFHFKMFWKKWCSTHFRNNFHMKTHVLNIFFISRCSERSDVQNPFGTISKWKLRFWIFSISRCSKRSDVPHTFGTISTWKLTFWTLFFISRCSERSDVQNPFGTISKWKLRFWIFFISRCSERSDVQNTLGTISCENSRFEHFFHFKMFWKKWCSKHSWNNFHMETHVLNTFSLSRCSGRGDVPNTLGTNSTWKLTFWTLFPFQDVLKEMMSHTLFEYLRCENLVLNTFSISRCSDRSDVPSTLATFFTWKLTFWTLFFISRCSDRTSIPNTLRTISIWKLAFWTLFRFQNILKELMSETLFEQLPCENTVLNTFSISRCSDRSDVPSTLATFLRHFSRENSRFEHFFSFQDVLTELVFRTPFEQFQYESSRFEHSHFFDFKIFWKNWCPKHFSNNYHVKTLFWTLFPFQDVLTEVMFQALLLQYNFHMKTHILNTFSISRCSERSSIPNTLRTISIWKLAFWTLFRFQNVLKELMSETLFE